MRITDIETIVLRLPTVLANGDGLQDTLIVKVHTDEGIVGLGEVHTSPTVARAVIEAPISQRTVQGFKQLLVGRDPRRINELWQLLYDCSTTYGRRGIVVNVLSGVDLALWDILGKSLSAPVHQLLGGKVHEAVPAYASDLSPPTIEEAVAKLAGYRAAGFRAAKFGWGGLGGDVRRDVARMHKLRHHVGDDMDILIDVGVPMPFDSALHLARGLAEARAYLLEEPLSPDDLAGFRRLVDLSPTPIATGEKETTRFGFRDLIDTGGLRIIQPDIARAGGLTEMVRIAAYAELRGARVIPHCWASDILVSATLQFLATRSDETLLEFNVMDNPLRTELVTEPFRVVDGVVKVRDAPGLGVDLNDDIVKRYRVS